MKYIVIINLLMNSILKSKIVMESFATSKAYFMIPVAIGVTTVKIELAIYLLASLMGFDFITGIGASYYKRKRLIKEQPKAEHCDLISSEKLKKSGIKFLLYGTTTVLAYFLEQIFLVKTIQFGFSEAKFTISIIVIGFWCLVEFYSIVFENFKEMGFDVVEKLKIIIGRYKSTKNDLSDM